jgi:AraC-like DNA-binding protein
MTAPVQWARIYRVGPPYSAEIVHAEIVHARYVEHRFARHAHEHCVVGLVEDMSLAQLGVLTSRSPTHLAHAFAWEVGLPPHAYLESIRVRQARAMLRSGVTVAATGLAVGYSDQSHFTHRFRRLTGLTPAQYARGAR